eukprot:6213006-Pleurochrysis_carterae.AAC.3
MSIFFVVTRWRANSPKRFSKCCGSGKSSSSTHLAVPDSKPIYFGFACGTPCLQLRQKLYHLRRTNIFANPFTSLIFDHPQGPEPKCTGQSKHQGTALLLATTDVWRQHRPLVRLLLKSIRREAAGYRAHMIFIRLLHVTPPLRLAQTISRDSTRTTRQAFLALALLTKNGFPSGLAHCCKQSQGEMSSNQDKGPLLRLRMRLTLKCSSTASALGIFASLMQPQ